MILHVAWNNQNQTNVFFLTCMVHVFPKESCVAGGTDFCEFSVLHVSGRRQFKRGTCDV